VCQRQLLPLRAPHKALKGGEGLSLLWIRLRAEPIDEDILDEDILIDYIGARVK
jgi:hypothetical protein